MKTNDKSGSNKKIILYLVLETLLVFMISIPLFLFRAKSGSSFVMIVSVIFMWIPALVTFLTRKLTHDKSTLPLRLNIKESWKKYLLAAYLPSMLIVLGAALYFILFSQDLDLTFSFVESLVAVTGQRMSVPTITKGRLVIISVGLILVAPLVIINHILAFGEEIGWRGYLLPLLCERIGTVWGTLLDGALWGIVHAPLVYFGVNYAGDYVGAPWTGMLMMVIFATTVGIFLVYVTIRTQSIVPACIAHGVINAIREAPLFVCVVDYNALLGPKPSGIIGMFGFLVLGVIILIKIGKEKNNI